MIVLETVDTEGRVLRQVETGTITVRYGGYGKGWIPDRRAGEVSLQATKDGLRFAFVRLVEDERDASVSDNVTTQTASKNEAAERLEELRTVVAAMWDSVENSTGSSTLERDMEWEARWSRVSELLRILDELEAQQ